MTNNGQPLLRRHAIWPEFFQGAEVFTGEQPAVLAKFGGGGVVQQVRRIGRTHLERHAHFKLTQRHAIEQPAHVVVRVAPYERMHAPGRAVAQDLSPLLIRAGRLIAIHRKAEVVFATA